MKIETIPIGDLVPYARNSRTHSEEQVAQIAASIKEFGFTNPVLIDSEGGIIAGHGRVLAARQFGISEVPCIRLSHLTEAQRRAYVIADNKLALNSGWDEEKLSSELLYLSTLENTEIALTGFSQEEFEAIFDERLMRETIAAANAFVERPSIQHKEKEPRYCQHCGEEII